MSRFQWLEFEKPSGGRSGGDGSGDQDTPPHGGDPTDPLYILRLADEAYRRMESEKALKLYSRALGVDPTLEIAWAGQLRCLLDLQENPEALTWAVKAQKTFGKSPDIQASRAVAIARSGNLSEAMAFSDGSMKSDHLGWYPWVARGEILAMSVSGNADFCMTKAREAAPNDWFIHLKVAQGYKNAGCPERAVPVFRKVLGMQSDLAEAWYELGECQLAIGSYLDARASFEKASRLSPHNKIYATAHTNMANTGPFEQFFGWIKGCLKGVFGK